MKSLASDIAASFSLFGGAKPRILVEIVTTGGTEYYSDQYLIVGTQSYQARILSWGRMSMETALGEDFIRQGNIPIKLSNHTPKISGDIDAGDAVSIFLWDANSAAGSKFKIFEGTVNDDIVAGYDEFSFTCTDVSAKYNKLIGVPLPTQADGSGDFGSSYDPDPNDIGKIQPIPYGSNKNSRCLAIESGAASTLRLDETAAATTIEVDDTTRFASSGEAVTGTEEISYSGKTADSLTGVTRGINGTTATTHNKGDAIFQNVATVKYMASSRIAKAITNAAIVPWGAPREEKVSVNEFASYVVNDSGIGTIELNSLPQIKKKVDIAVSQQPSVSLQQQFSGAATHKHQPGSNRTITYFYDTSVHVQTGGSVANPERISDKGFTAEASISGYTTFTHTITKIAIEQHDGVPKKQKAYVRARTSSGTVPLLLKLYIGNVLQESKSITVTTTNTTFGLTAGGDSGFYSLGTFDWTDFNTAPDQRIEIVSNGSPGVSTLFISEGWTEVQYLPEVEEETISDGTIATSGATETQLGGDSVAGNLGGFLVCDIDGEPDVGGHWTGSGTDLIEKPVDIIHHILETFTNGPVAHADIDLAGSFADAETNHSSMDVWGFVITDQIWVNELLTLLAQQFFCRFIYEAGTAKLNRILLSPGSANDRSVDTDWDSVKRNGKLTVKEDRWGKDLVWNDVTVNYDIDLILSGGNWFSPDSYFQHSQDEDATSISANGRQTRVFNAFAIVDNTSYADDLRDKLLSFYKENRRWVSFVSWTTLLALERGDEIDITTSQLDLSAFDAQIVNIEIDLPKRGQSIAPIITALEI